MGRPHRGGAGCCAHTGSEWTVRAAVPGRLIELNLRAATDPSLLTPALARTEGFLAIIAARPDKLSQIKSALLSKREFAMLRCHRTGAAATAPQD